jgi:hypothetical protein
MRGKVMKLRGAIKGEDNTPQWAEYLSTDGHWVSTNPQSSENPIDENTLFTIYIHESDYPVTEDLPKLDAAKAEFREFIRGRIQRLEAMLERRAQNICDCSEHVSRILKNNLAEARRECEGGLVGVWVRCTSRRIDHADDCLRSFLENLGSLDDAETFIGARASSGPESAEFVKQSIAVLEEFVETLTAEEDFPQFEVDKQIAKMAYIKTLIASYEAIQETALPSIHSYVSKNRKADPHSPMVFINLDGSCFVNSVVQALLNIPGICQ